MYDKVTEASLLYDFYAGLLTEKQQEVTRLYHEENLSLSEIAAEYAISRQAVHDALKNAERSLYEYEDKLGLVRKFADTEKTIGDVTRQLDTIIHQHSDRSDLVRQMVDIKDRIGQLG